MPLAFKRMVKLLVYGGLLAFGFVLTFFFGRQGGEYSITHGGINAPVAYADAPPLGDGDDYYVGDAGDGSGGDGDCGASDDDGY